MSASAHFVLSFTRAMTDQLSELLAELEPARLDPLQLDELERLPGVYELLQDGPDGRRVMYVGKADWSLPDRLADHYRKIRCRENIDVRNMYFVCAYVERDLHAVAPEAMLIDHRRRAGDAPWNGRVGFGPHDPGRERDTQDPPPWDLDHPIRIDDVIGFPGGRDYDLTEYLYELKAALPFLFRFQRVDNRRGSGHPDYEGLSVRIPADLTARELLVYPTIVLPEGWRTTILPGYAILYKNRSRSPVTLAEYESGDAPGRRAGYLDRRDQR